MRAIVFLFAGFNAFQSFAQVALTPATPAISTSPVFVPGSPALSPAPNNTTAALTTNATLVALSQSLMSLQTNLEQALPLLINFNDSFDFVNLAGSTAVNQANGNVVVDHGANASLPTGRSLFNAPASATAQVPAGVAEGVATIPVTSDVLRALLVLQSDVQRMVPVLNFLNNGATNSPGTFTNLFGVPPISQ